MIRKAKNEGGEEAAKKKEQQAEAAAPAEPEQNGAETGAAEGAAAETAEADRAASSDAGAGTAGGEAEAKKPSDLDILKAYLAQTLEELKKTQKENEELRTRGERLESQSDALRSKLEGVVAEYDNFRRRTAEEKEALGSDAKIKVVKALLPALDNLERAMPYAASNPESFEKGVEMTLRQMADAFQALGVTEIEAQGLEFDPKLHDAVMHVDDDSVGEGVVTEVFQKGYKLGNKVIRHSVVKVAN